MDKHLRECEKPTRYLGGEPGTIHKEHADIRFALAFPDVYEVGMSHLGLQILYGILNGPEWLAAERVYAPWPDMEEALRRHDLPLTTLESGTPLNCVDILGFTLQYELSYTNLLNMLDLGGIPLKRQDRDDRHPLVIAGGPCAANPEPLADFIDAFLVGDGEEAALEIAETYRQSRSQGESRTELLKRLATIAGVYVPAFFDIAYHDDGTIADVRPLLEGYSSVRRRVLAELETAPYPTSPVVPFMKTVHDRVSVEVARGCTRGCRFCQAGYLYRPVRERSPQRIGTIVEQALASSGYDEISLLSLSTGDYGCISDLLRQLMQRHAPERVAVSLPSLRVGTLTKELVDEVRKVRKTGFTLAPEAGTDRLRRVINKGITEEDLLANATEAYGAGWRLIKLYFMMGLPTETRDDLIAIADLARRVKDCGKKAGAPGEVNVAVSSFVPKPHTPFQWEPQIGMEDIVANQRLLRDELRKRKLNFKWQDAHLTFLEGVFARGDRRLGKVLEQAHRLGCRFDGWGDRCDLKLWLQAFAETGIDPVFYHRRRALDEILPWNHIDIGVTGEYLRRELEKGLAEGATPDCRTGCTDCGVCDFRTVKMSLHDEKPVLTTPQAVDETGRRRIRLRFAKRDRMRFLSHLELLNLFTRMVRGARIPILYSQGFHPHPKFSFATALSVGIESDAEYLEMEVAEGCTPEAAMERLNARLPAGLRIMEATDVPPQTPSLSVLSAATRYRVHLPSISAEELAKRLNAFLALDTFIWKREKKGEIKELDLRQELLEADVQDGSIMLLIRRGKPVEVTAAILETTVDALADARIEKLEVILADPAAAAATADASVM